MLFAHALLVAQAPAKPASTLVVKPVAALMGLKAISFAAAPSGSKFAVGLADNSIRIIDAYTHQTLKTLKGHPQPCYALAWSKDGKWLASGDESARIWIWDLDTGTKIKEFRSHPRGIQHLSFNSKKTFLISTGKEDAIKIYDLKKWKEVRTIAGQGANFYSATFCPVNDKFTCATLGAEERIYASDGSKVAGMAGHAGMGALDIDFSPTGDRIASAGKDSNVIVWNADARQKMQTLHGHTDWVEYVKFSPNGKYLATGSNDRTVRIWDLKTFKPAAMLDNACAIGSPVCWTADGKYLISVNLDDDLQISTVTPPQSAKPEKAPRRRHRRAH